MAEDTKIKEMFKAGAHFGFSKSRRHPSVKPFVFGMKNSVEIIDLEKTKESLKEAKDFVKKLGEQGKTLLFVGTKFEARQHVEDAARLADAPYVALRWIGGTFTNFPEIKKRIDRLTELQEKKQKGELSVYTKREQLLLDREREKLEKFFGGLLSLDKIPDAVFIVDPKENHITVTEAQTKNIPLVALASTDCNLREIDYPIVANDSSQASIKFFVTEIAEAYKEGKDNKPADKPAENKESKNENNEA